MAGRYSVEAIFKAVDRISAPVRAMQRSVSRAVEGMQRTSSRIGDSMGRSFRGVQAVSAMLGGSLSRALEPARDHISALDRGFMAMGGAAVVAGSAVAGIASSIIDTGATFERTLMSAVARFPGAIQRGSDAFRGLQQAAERVGATTEFDAQQAAGALNVFAAAGFSAEQAIASLAGAGDLATVSGLQLDEAAATAADSLGALGLRAQNATELAANLTRVNDLFARTTSLANTSATDMAEAVKAGGNAAVRSGASIETFGALVASMAGSNIKGAEAGTAIRNMFLRLQAPARSGQRALRQLGISVRDSDGNMRDMVTVMGELATATAGMGTAEKNAALSRIFGAETIGPALAVLGTGAEGLAQFRTQLEQSQGAAANMAATMRDTAAGDIDGFTSAIDGVKTAIFGMVSGPLRQVLQSMTEWIGANTQWISSGIGGVVQNLADNFGTLVQRMKGIAVVVGVLAALSLGFKALSAAAMVFNAIAAMNPYVLLFYVILAAIGLIVAYWPEISAFFQRMWEKAKSVGAAIADWFRAKWEAIKAGVSALASTISSAFATAWEWIVSTSTSVYERIVGVFEGLRGWFAGLWSSIAGTFESIVGAIMDRISSVVATVQGLGGQLFGGEGDQPGAGGAGGGPQVVSPQERTARSVSESSSTTRSEVTIRDQTGRAQITRQPRNGPALRLQPSGST